MWRSSKPATQAKETRELPFPSPRSTVLALYVDRSVRVAPYRPGRIRFGSGKHACRLRRAVRGNPANALLCPFCVVESPYTAQSGGAVAEIESVEMLASCPRINAVGHRAAQRPVPELQGRDGVRSGEGR